MVANTKVVDGEAGKKILLSIMEEQPKGLYFKDLKNMPLDSWDVRGKKSRGTFFDMGTKLFEMHLAEIPPGTNKKAHRHRIEAVIYIVKGKGYSMMWPEGQEPKRYDWSEGDLFCVPMNWWHQHFNLDSKETARYLAVTTIGFMESLGMLDTAQQEE